ncbi:patatin-like phospholipase family protein [Mesorhizobium sp. 131-2-1]|uniref:patatin-like phospholipase family protein n=1 Tax=Mesorhizobium sp. 131-2-1 TaxID=2744518 RepID=UPI0019370BB9|nr:patatin-like phospholipase family protein [Mesorhizobium sp. 131-2-1]BCG96644.1 alpha/beta hydrolase [Mesorhizobium sp. 131-2-1]
MHIQTGTETDHALIARPAVGDRRVVDIVLASDAHGAFVWGVLDRLLDEPSLSICNITASGFGAMEAVVLAYGLALGGRRGARTALANFWRRVSHASMFAADAASPLRSILEQSIDIAVIRDKNRPLQLSILASNARTDAVKIFAGDQLSIDAILAAATIPFLFPAVEIDGDSYWGDGDLSALPALQLDTGHRLVVTGKPTLFTTPCADRRLAATPCAMKCAPTHAIFDRQHRAGAALFTRPWTDWGELTDMRDRGRERAGDWLFADNSVADECSAVDGKNRYL